MKTNHRSVKAQDAITPETPLKSKESSAGATTSTECSCSGALYKGAHESFKGGWMCGRCGRIKELPREYAVVFMAFPLLKD